MKPEAIPPLLVAAVGLYVALTQLPLYIRRRRDSEHLSFALMALVVAALAAATAGLYNTDSPRIGASWQSAQHSLQSLFAILLLTFLYNIRKRSLDRIYFAAAAFGAVLIALAALTDLDVNPNQPAVKRVEWAGIAYHESEVSWMMYVQILYAVVMAALCLRLAMRVGVHGFDREATLPVLGGIIVLALTVVNDIAVQLELYSSLYLMEYGLLFFLLGIAQGLHVRFDGLAQNLALSEEKYRLLSEAMRDIVFVLDQDARIVAINRAAEAVLGYETRDLVGSSFFDLVYEAGDEGRPLRRYYLRERLEESRRSGGVSFRFEFRSRQGDAIELGVKLDFIQRKPPPGVYYGRAEYVMEDALLGYLEREEQVYALGNNLTLGDLLNRRITSSLAKRLTGEEFLDVRLGLHEILVNAIEHGNLGITFEEKAGALAEGKFMELIRSRQQDPRYRDRRVRVEYRLSSDRVEFLVEDEGAGFDHAGMLNRDIRVGDSRSLMHGRGIKLALACFDIIEYNDSGNQVFLMKRLPRAIPGVLA